MSSADVLVRGRNKELLFEKLKRAGVRVLKTEVKGGDLVIRVKYKDLKKAFAIFGNMWYNKLVKLHGAARVVSAIRKHVAVSVSVALFFALSIAVDEFVFFIKVDGVSEAKSLAITSLLTEYGVKPFALARSLDTKKIKSGILGGDFGAEFVGIEKRANTLLVRIKEGKRDAESGEAPRSIIARESGVIKDISVLRGSAKKSVGDKVFAGEVVIDGISTDGELVFEDRAAGRFSIECEKSFETFIADTAEETVGAEVSRLIAMLDKDGATAKTEIASSGGGYILKVTVTYSVTESGGYFEQNDG